MKGTHIMRFLIFNLVVVGALTYLATGGNISLDRVRDMVSRSVEKTDEAEVKLPIPNVEPLQFDADIKKEDNDFLEPQVSEPQSGATARPPMPPIVPMIEREIIAPIVHAAPNGKGIGKALVEEVRAKPEALLAQNEPLMTPEERRRELHALARSMEREFIRRVVD
jgi:hypothetical protein